MAIPKWLGKVSKRDDKLRGAHGLYAANDGWYKTIGGKKRYVAKPMPLADALKILPSRIESITGNVVEKPTRIATGSTTIGELVEIFLAHLWQRHKTGSPRKMVRRTYDDYVDVLSRFAIAAGSGQPAAAVDTTWFSRFMRTLSNVAETTRRREIIYITAFFNWAGPGRHSQNFYKTPVQFGPDFRKPEEAKLQAALDGSSTLYTPEQFRKAIWTVEPCPLLYAVGLLAMNCALIPIDLIEIPVEAIDLDAGTLNFKRGKTGGARYGELMPATVNAIRRYLKWRPPIRSAREPLFVNDKGKPFGGPKDAGADERGTHTNAIGQYWGAITGLPLKGLRTTFSTIADGLGDDRALDIIMGHVADSVRAKHYVKQIDGARIRAMTEQVWQRVSVGPDLPVVAEIGAFRLKRRVGKRASPLSKRVGRPQKSCTVGALRSVRARLAQKAARLQSAT